MTVMIALLRGINVGGHHLIRMDALRKVCESLGLRDIQTHLQSGNVVFKTSARDAARLRKRIEDALERSFGFRPSVILRTPSELREIVARNPFAARPGMEPSKLAIHFLGDHPIPEARRLVLGMKTDPEELHMEARELYIYFTNGMARPNLSIALVEKTLKTPGTSRNWNTVRKLLEIAEKLEL